MLLAPALSLLIWSAAADDVKDGYLEAVERQVRWLHRHQDAEGAILDLALGTEFQYTTPYYAYALYACRAGGRCADLEASFHAAMDHCTEQVARGSRAIPDQHGEFFLASLGELLYLIQEHPDASAWIDAEALARWRERMSVPVERVIEGLDDKLNNHRAYAMKGEYFRAKAGLIPQEYADAFIADAWEQRGLKYRLNSRDGIYTYFEDWNGDPQSQTVSLVGLSNLLPITRPGGGWLLGEDSRERSIWNLRHFVDPSGQCPPNGRTDNHVFGDALVCALFEYYYGLYQRDAEKGEQAAACGALAARSFASMQRWLRDDPPYDGIYSITKNYFDPAEGVGYQPASQVSNYTVTVAVLLAQAWWSRPEDAAADTAIDIPYEPVVEAAGTLAYNREGCHALVNLTGDSVPKYGIFWTPLGVARLARAGWDSRLGPSDGQYDARAREGLSIAPTWREGKDWTHLCERAEHYRGTSRTDGNAVSVLYAPVTGVGGPMFEVTLEALEQGVLMRFRSPSDARFGVSLPVLEDDGRALEVRSTERAVSVRYPQALSDGSEQIFLVLNKDAALEKTETRVRSTYGWLQEYRASTKDPELRVFAYMRRGDEPSLGLMLVGMQSQWEQLESDPAAALRVLLR